MSEEGCDLVVIGAGPGGYTAAFFAADRGLKVTVVEQDSVMGGVCLNSGCIPSKSLLHLSKLRNEVDEAREMGMVFSEPEIQLDKIRAFKNNVISKLNNGIRQLADMRKVKVIHGSASFESPYRLLINTADGQVDLRFKNCIIAAGSRPFIPKALSIDSKRVMDSTAALALTDIPEKLLVVGGGVIGLELGSAYASFGSSVSVMEAAPSLAAPVDRDLFRPLEKRLTKLFGQILTNTKVQSLEEVGQKVRVSYQSEGEEVKTAEYDRVLVCIGRVPNADMLRLEMADVEMDEKGFIKVDSSQQTSVSNIYAIGDIVGQPMLAHKSSAEAKIAVEHILGEKSEFDHAGIPSVIYTDPEIAWVGLTEQDAKAKGILYKVGKFPWSASGRAMTSSRTEGLTKILSDPATGRVLGVSIAGINAGEMIAEATLALEMGCVVDDISNTIHAHPTLSETFMESAEAMYGMATHLSPVKPK